MTLGPPASRSRAALESFFSFAPDFGYVQAGGSLPISVGLAPAADMVARLAKWAVGPAEEVRAAAAGAGPRLMMLAFGARCSKCCLLCKSWGGRPA